MAERSAMRGREREEVREEGKAAVAAVAAAGARAAIPSRLLEDAGLHRIYLGSSVPFV